MGAGTRICLESGGLEEAKGALQSAPRPAVQETGPCSFVYKCRGALGEAGLGTEPFSKRKAKGLGVKKWELCSLPSSDLSALCLARRKNN